VTLHPIILSLTPPPAAQHVSGRTPLERFMSWMMVVAIGWLFWLYDYIPGWPSRRVGDHFHRLLADLLSGTALPVYADVGLAISRFTDWFGTSSATSTRRSRRASSGWRCDWRRPAMATLLVTLLTFGLYFQHQLKVGDMTGCRAPVPGASVQCRLQQGEREVRRCQPAGGHRGGQETRSDQGRQDAQRPRSVSALHGNRPGAGGSITTTTVLKKIFRTFHEGDPKWEICRRATITSANCSS